MSWATPAEAQSITGDATLTQAQLDVATHLLEIFAGAVEDSRTNLTNRDLRLLKKAESYQAAWMVAQVDLLGRSDATLVSQDGLQYSKGDADMHVLSPLAKASIMRLSWMRTRTLDPLTPAQALVLRNKVTAETYGLDDREDLDDLGGNWEPL
jgi:hypothetical protein